MANIRKPLETPTARDSDPARQNAPEVHLESFKGAEHAINTIETILFGPPLPYSDEEGIRCIPPSVTFAAPYHPPASAHLPMPAHALELRMESRSRNEEMAIPYHDEEGGKILRGIITGAFQDQGIDFNSWSHREYPKIPNETREIPKEDLARIDFAKLQDYLETHGMQRALEYSLSKNGRIKRELDGRIGAIIQRYPKEAQLAVLNGIKNSAEEKIREQRAKIGVRDR